MKAQEEQKKEVSAQDEQESQTREGKAQEERRKEREVEAQEGHDGEKEMTTQEKCVDAKKEVNSMHEENDVSNRHMTWWRDAWWVRMDNGPHLRTARGRRRVWRPATRAAREARETERVAGGEREKWEQEVTGRKESNTLHAVFHLPHNSKYNTHNNSSSGGSKRRNASAVARRPGVFQLKELVTKVELLFPDDVMMWMRIALSFSGARVHGRLRPHQRRAGVSGGFPGDSHREGHV